eukprot:c26190_g1_i10 orf=144-1475(+)
MVTCCYAMMQMEKAWRRSFPIQKDAAPRFGTMGSSSVARCSGLRPEYKEYGCCSKSSADTSSRAAKHVAPRDCTYGDCQGLWLADELQRLLSMQKKPINGMVLTRGSWTWDIDLPTVYRFRGIMQFCNITRASEIFINEVCGRVVLLSNNSPDLVTTSIEIHPKHPGVKPAPRKDGYWPAYITQAGKATSIEVVLHIHANKSGLLKELQAACVEIEYVSYGPHGCSFDVQHVILPLQYPRVLENNPWQRVGGAGAILPIRTHLLSHLDNPKEVLSTYVLPHIEVGDVIAICETPLAIMQGRFRHPCGIYPSIVARLACRLFHPTSSLATACGMQVLIDISGQLRVLFAVIIAVISRLFGIRGMFYRLAGKQVHAQATVDDLKTKTGFGVAIVDVNDLKQVHILAVSFNLQQIVESESIALYLKYPSMLKLLLLSSFDFRHQMR